MLIWRESTVDCTCFWDVRLPEPTSHPSPKSLLQGSSSIASVHKTCLIIQETPSAAMAADYSVSLSPGLQRTHLSSSAFDGPGKHSVFLGKRFRVLLFSASQGSRNCEIISILCLYVPWSCYTVQSEIEIRPQGFANDVFSLSMAHAHSWGVTELAFIVLHFSSE